MDENKLKEKLNKLVNELISRRWKFLNDETTKSSHNSKDAEKYLEMAIYFFTIIANMNCASVFPSSALLVNQ